ncbi:MAG: hypothetical protein ACK2U5_03850 [Candidatus Promineifilaceae bacterium]|jgi:protein-S-isoprenylcysteine O-methyltransferase Ste14
MSFDWTQVAGIGIVFFGAAFLFLQMRYRPRATKEVQTAADLAQRISGSRYTLVQLFAPM